MTKTRMFVLQMAFLKKYCIPLLLVLVNIFIKSLYLVSESISHDEPFTIYHAQFDFFSLIHYLKNYNNPPLFEVILHFWIKYFGISAESVRILPMLFSSFSVFFIYKIGKDFFDEKVAILSSVLFTFSIMQIWYAHDCRVYSLFLLLTLISFYFFFKLLKEEKLSKVNFFLFVFVNVLILYSHYFGAFIWVLEGLIILIFYLKNRSVLKSFVMAVVISAMAYVPQLLILFERFFDSAKNGTWLKAPIGLESLYNMIWSFSNAPVVAVICIALLVIASIKFLFFTNRQMQNSFTTYVMIWFFFPFVFMFLISYKIPMFLDRYLIFITPAFYILLALGISFLFPRKIIYYTAAAVLIIAFGFSSSFNPDKKRMVKETVDFIRSKKDDKTIVLVCSPDFMTNFAYYYNQNYFKQIDQKSEYGKLEGSLKNENIYFINRLDPTIYEKINAFDKIIYLDAGADFASPDNFIKQDLFSNYKLAEEKFYFEIFNTYIFTKN